MKKIVLFLSIFWIITTLSFGQIIVKGRVVDENQKPVSDLMIRSIKLKKTTFTDSLGQFEIKVESKYDTLTFAPNLRPKFKVCVADIGGGVVMI